MTKIYSKIGDEGTTKNLSGETVHKDDCEIEVIGLLDSLMSQMDKVLYGLNILPKETHQLNICNNINTLLWQFGGEISGKKILELIKTPIEKIHIEIIEKEIDNLSNNALHKFTRFCNPIAMDIDEARIRTRKLERELTKYLRENKLRKTAYIYINRLSDYLFVLANYINKIYG